MQKLGCMNTSCQVLTITTSHTVLLLYVQFDEVTCVGVVCVRRQMRSVVVECWTNQSTHTHTHTASLLCVYVHMYAYIVMRGGNHNIYTQVYYVNTYLRRYKLNITLDCFVVS